MTTPTFDPSAKTVDEVNAHLEDNPGDRDRVLSAERDGKARVGVLEGPQAATPDADPGPTDDRTPEQVQRDAVEAQARLQNPDGNGDTTTRALTFEESARAFRDPDVPTALLVGVSPERERTGLEDKGLSQRTPSVMNPMLPAVDARPSQDDSEAIAHAKRYGNPVRD